MTRTVSLLACLALAAPTVGQPRTDIHGDPLPDGALARFGSLRFRTGISDDLPAWALSPDGKTLAIGSGRDLTFWDIESGRVTLRLGPADSPVGEVAFSPNGKHLVRVDREKVSLFDSVTGDRRHSWDLLRPQVASFSPGTSRFVVTVHGQDFVHLFDADRPAELGIWDAEAALVAPSPSGRFFLGESDDGLHLVDAGTGRVRCRFATGPDPKVVTGATDPSKQLSGLSPDDRRLYVMCRSGALRTYDATTGRRLGELEPPPGWREDGGYGARLALSPDGSVAYLSRRDGPTHRRDLKAGKWLDPLPVMPGGPLVPHPDGKRLLLIGEDGFLRRYDLTTLREVPLPGFDEPLSAAASPDGHRVAITSGGAGARLDLFDRTGKTLWSVPIPGRPGPPRWSADGRRVACANEREVTVCHAATGKVLQTLRAPDGDRQFTGLFGFDAAGAWLVASLDNGEAVARFPLKRGGRAEVFETGVRSAVDVSPDGGSIAFENGGPSVALLDVAAGRFRTGWTFPPPPPRGCGGGGVYPDSGRMSFSPDGTYLLSRPESGMFALWDPVTGEPQRIIETGSASGDSALSPDGLWLALAGWNEVSLWDVPTGQQLFTWEAEPGARFTGVSFAGPGRLLTTLSDNTALLWDIRPKKKPAGPLWDALTGHDARAANQAAWALAADPRGPDILRTRISPARPAPAERLNRWLAHLGSDDYRLRETATRELRDLGRLVEPELRAAREKATSEEVRTRLDRLLIQVPRMRTPEEWVQARAVLGIEVAGTEAAKKVLAEWAAGAPGARLTQDAKAALGRLVADRP